MNKSIKILISVISISFISIIIVIGLVPFDGSVKEFNGQYAYGDVKYQVDQGPRTLGSEAHAQAANWIISTMKDLHWSIETQDTVISGAPVKNIIAKKGSGDHWIIIGSHYDSRPIADRDKTAEGRTQPVPGADDGASSVAVLLEIARDLPARLDAQIWLVFFDAEDYGGIPGYDWSMGSQYFVSQLQGKPDDVVILDMVGDKNLNIYMEKNSNPELNSEIWKVASSLGYTQFIPTYKQEITDDHIPFIKAGIKAIDIIDIDYPYWHTTQDTLDKISAESLKAVGETMLKWLGGYIRQSPLKTATP